MKELFPVLLLTAMAIATPREPASRDKGYVLGPEDTISVRVLELDEFDPKNTGTIRVDSSGNIRLPLVGRIRAAGLTVEQLETRIASGLAGIMVNPEVTVAVAEFRNHPVSVLGAVRSPGVYQITGQKTLYEVMSLAGGLNPDAGSKIKITRAVAAGRLPLPDSSQTGEFYIGELNVREVMEAKNPAQNILVMPYDVVTVPKADLVYVIGAVSRSGGFTLSEKEHISVLQALSMAEGLDRLAAPKSAKILRQSAPDAERAEIMVNLHQILEGRANDVAMQANDILFIPNNVAKSASMRIIEAAIQTGTGVVIWRR